MKLHVMAEEVNVRWPLWVVSVSVPPSVRAMFVDEQEARRYAEDLMSEWSNVRVLAVVGTE